MGNLWRHTGTHTERLVIQMDELAARRAAKESYRCPDCGSASFMAGIRLDHQGRVAEFVDVECAGCLTDLEILEPDDADE